MRFVSTRSESNKTWSLTEAVFMGYAPDGGMFMPEKIPHISNELLLQWCESYISDPINFQLYHQIAEDILSKFIDEEEIPKSAIRQILNEGISFPIKISHLSELNNSVTRSDDLNFDQKNIDWSKNSKHILELCHGPTYTFKDFGMQFLGRLMGYLLEKNDEKHKITIIVATSGDTGSAAIESVQNHPFIELFVIYPGNNRISKIQELQMATNEAKNIHCIRFDGSSDDADKIVTKLFNNKNLDKYYLTTLNSVNIGRILMQINHFVFAYVQSFASQIIESIKNQKPRPSIQFCIPTGGLGNGSSCYIAKQMGIPIENIIMAVNENDTISRIFSNMGQFKLNPVKITNSPAMDICNPYNFERILYLLSNNNHNLVNDFISQLNENSESNLSDSIFYLLKKEFISFSASQNDVVQQISSIFEKWNVIVDPHSSVALQALHHIDNDIPVICVSTAHPAKFVETIETATKLPYELPEELQNMLTKPLRVTDLEFTTMAEEMEKMIAEYF